MFVFLKFKKQDKSLKITEDRPFEEIGKGVYFFYSATNLENMLNSKNFFVYHRGIPAISPSGLEQVVAEYSALSDKSKYRLARGSYALLIYEKTDKCLRIYRDAWGTVPVYYYRDGSVVSDSISEIVSYTPHPELNKAVIGEYLASSYVVGEPTLYRDVLSLETLSMFESSGSKVSVYKNYMYPQMINMDNNEIQYRLETLIDTSVGNMAAAIHEPQKIFLSLSGGTDSSLLAAKMRHIYDSNAFKSGVVEYKNWERNDTVYHSRVVEAYSLQDEVMVIDNSVYADALVNLTYASRYAYHTFAPSAFALLGSIRKKFPDVLFHVNGTGPDEAAIGFEKVPLEEMKRFDKLPKAEWLDAFFSKMDYLYTPLDTVYACLGRCRRFDIMKTRRRLAKDIAAAADTFSEFQRRYAMETITDHHIKMLYHISQLAGLEAIFPYCTQELFELLFSIPYYTLNTEISHKHVFKKILRKYFDDEFVFRQKIGFHAPSRSYFKEEKGLGALLRNLSFEASKSLFSLPNVKQEIESRLKKEDAPLDYLLWTITNIALLSDIVNSRTNK